MHYLGFTNTGPSVATKVTFRSQNGVALFDMLHCNFDKLVRRSFAILRIDLTCVNSVQFDTYLFTTSLKKNVDDHFRAQSEMRKTFLHFLSKFKFRPKTAEYRHDYCCILHHQVLSKLRSESGMTFGRTTRALWSVRQHPPCFLITFT